MTDAPMPTRACVLGLYIADQAGAAMRSCNSVEVLTGVGVVGDRYANRQGYWSDAQWPDQELTLIESEVAEQLGVDAGSLRRNVVTRGVRLDDLIGVAFLVGDVVLVGVRRCDPCQYLETLTRPGLARELVARGGLRAHIQRGGRIRMGDPLVTTRSGVPR